MVMQHHSSHIHHVSPDNLNISDQYPDWCREACHKQAPPPAAELAAAHWFCFIVTWLQRLCKLDFSLLLRLSQNACAYTLCRLTKNNFVPTRPSCKRHNN